MALGPASLAQTTLKSASPAAAACFSTSACFSITIKGRKLTPYCWATTISFTSARPLVVNATDSARNSASDVTRKVMEILPGRGHLLTGYLIGIRMRGGELFYN